MKLGQIPEEWKLVLVHPKEREMKMEPRLFAMMVLEMRLYFCVTESNLSSPGGARFLSTLDMNDGFWQFPLEESSREKMAFTISKRGLFHFVT